MCLNYEHSLHPITANVTTGVATGEGRDRLVGPFRCLRGSDFSDHLVGSELR